MTQLTRRELLRRTGTVAIGGAAMAAAPSVFPRAFARAAAGHCGWGAYVDPLGGDTTLAIRRFQDQIGRKVETTRHSIRWNGTWRTGRSAGARGPATSRWSTSARRGAAATGPTSRKASTTPTSRRMGARSATSRTRAPSSSTTSRRTTRPAALRPTSRLRSIRGGRPAWVPFGCDLLGVDGNNRGACNPLNGWQSFSVGREACGEHDRVSRAAWLSEAADTITSWTEIEAVVYSNTRAEYNGQELTFRVDAAATSLAAYREIGRRAYFS